MQGTEEIIKHLIDLGKNVGLVVFTYVFAVKKTVKTKQAEIDLEEKHEERERFGAQSREFPLLVASVSAQAREINSINERIDNLYLENSRIRSRIEKNIDDTSNYREKIEQKMDTIQQNITEIILANREKIFTTAKEINEISVSINHVKSEIAKITNQQN